MGIGRRIKQAREALHLTQKELGDILGVTGSSITNYENEISHPKEPIMYKLIEALDVDANFLFQDCVNIRNKSFQSTTRLGAETLQVAHAYEAADSGTKGAVRKLLDVDKPSGRIEKELASYRLELEAEEEAKRLSALETIGASTETRKMA